MNKSIRILEDKLIEDLNAAADVEIEVKRLILSNILNQVTKQADNAIILELSEAQDAESIHENRLGE